MKKLNEMRYLAGILDQNHYYGESYDKASIKKITRRINRIIENIDNAIEDAAKSKDPIDDSKETSSAESFFEKLKKGIGTPDKNNLSGESPSGIERKADAVRSKLAEFKIKFEQANPKVANQLEEEASKDASMLKGELPVKAESILGVLGKGAAMIGGTILWAAWKTIKFVLFQTVRLIIRIGRSLTSEKNPKKVLGYNVEGLPSMATACFALLFPFLSFFAYGTGHIALGGGLLIPSGIYYVYLILTQLLDSKY